MRAVTGRAVVAGLLLALVGGVGVGCSTRQGAARDVAGDAAAPVGSDTLRGVVRIVGADPGVATLDAVGAAGRPRAVLVETDAALRAAAGLEVVVRGSVRGTSDALPVATPAFVVRSFAVRAVDGVAAVDGVLVRDGDRLALRFADGAQAALAAPPTALQSLVGARIYWVGAFDRPPQAYGLLSR